MLDSSKSDAVDRIFKQDPELKKRIYETIQQAPQLSQLFDDIAYFVEDYIKPGTSNAIHTTNEPPAKKRRLENGVENHGPPETITLGVETLLLRVKDVSFAMPKRTKLHLEIMKVGATPYIRGIIPTSGAKSVEDLAEFYKHVFKLPVPEKAQKQYNYCLLPEAKKLLNPEGIFEPMLWTVNAGPIKNYERGDSIEDYDPETIIDEVLRSVGLPVIEPVEKEFASATPEAHRKKETAFHVKAFKGSKDGYLFFLPTGILFGYKKPLLFYSFDVIESTSYTSVLQRTFNLTIAYKFVSDMGSVPDSDPQEVEFSMLDQSDFAGIDAYLKRHDLQDASMAEARRAKTVKKAAGAKSTTLAANGDGAEGEVDDRTELQKAEQQLDDEEDEQEEDFEPSDDDDGSGSESESEDDDAYRRKVKGRDLVKEELGSEAEDVSADEEDDAEVEAEDDEDEDEEDEDESTQAHQKSATTKPASSKESQKSTKLASHGGPASRKPSNMPELSDEDQL